MFSLGLYGVDAFMYIQTFQFEPGKRRLTIQEVDTLDHFGLSSESMDEAPPKVSIVKSYVIPFTPE